MPKRVAILGVPLAFGANMAGVDMGPSALRVARLGQRIAQLGYEVRDLGDVPVAAARSPAASDEPAKHLREVTEACEHLAGKVQSALGDGDFPLVLGGDHSIAVGSVSGVAAHFKERGQGCVGLLWFDAHADMNTAETTGSGNIHGMPLAALLGHGLAELTHLAGFAPKLNPQWCAHIGARDIDPGERELIKRTGVRFYTMREVDERGMAVCVDEALAIVSQSAAGYHVTVDVDVLDPGDAPGSGTLVRGGLTYRESHLAMEKVAERGGMVSLEIVEINTALDTNNRTAELGVELILSALGKKIL
ncbi:MAG: arginase [Pyrinomonadaceae bacterium]